MYDFRISGTSKSNVWYKRHINAYSPIKRESFSQSLQIKRNVISTNSSLSALYIPRYCFHLTRNNQGLFQSTQSAPGMQSFAPKQLV